MRSLGKSFFRVGLPAAVLVVAGSASFGLVATAASASTLDGTATITNPNTNLPLTSGGSTTVFTVDLPAQAACTGDTASDGYHVYSYLVSKTTNIVTGLNFSSGTPSTGFGLIDSSGYYGPANTAPTTGQIIDNPADFEWADLLNAGATASGLTGASSTTWEAGLACANSSGTVTDYWNTPVTFTKSTTDPNKFTWTAGVPLDTTKTTVKCAPKKGKTGKADKCTATVADTKSKTTKPTGTVTFSGGTGAFGTPTCTLAAGKCTDTFTPSAKGTDTLTASYGGSATEAASSGTAKLKVT
jgi:hypothetical protein